MKFLPFIAPILFCSFGLALSSVNHLLGLIVASLGLPLWFLIRWMDPESPKTLSQSGNQEK